MQCKIDNLMLIFWKSDCVKQKKIGFYAKIDKKKSFAQTIAKALRFIKLSWRIE